MNRLLEGLATAVRVAALIVAAVFALLMAIGLMAA